MPRNFGLNQSAFDIRKSAKDYWNGSSEDTTPRAIWPLVLIGAGVLMMFGVAIFAR